MNTDELFAAALASLEADAARVDELDRLYRARFGRALGNPALVDAGRAVIKRIGELTRNPHRDMSSIVGESFADGRAAVEAAIARLQGE